MAVEGWRFCPAPVGRTRLCKLYFAAKDLALNLPDVQPQSGQHDCNGDQAHPESDTTLIALNHRGLPGLQVAGGDLQSDLNIRIHEVRLEAMDGHASFCQ